MTETQNGITINDLDFFYMPNGVPCFLGNKENVINIIENDLQFTIYYILTDKSTFKTYTKTEPSGYQQIPGSYSRIWTSGKTTEIVEEDRQMCLFKVVKNMIGRVCQPVENDAFGETFVGLEAEAIYNLPAIPKTLIAKLDEFFRLVHAQHGTESIVMLTFDTTNMTSDSWGILVPKQENTSVHCKYDPESIVEMKEEHLSIVGSVHSHPEMAAYASGTDHEDQADFDGLHITFGWQKTKDNNATQYHIEMQMAGVAYTLKPEDVFEIETKINDPDPEVVKWTENVSKKAYPPYSASGDTIKQPYQQPHQQPQTTSNTTTSTTDIGRSTRQNLLGSITDIHLQDDVILVCEVEPYAQVVHCPLCEYELSTVDINNRMCSGCEGIIATPSDNVQDIIASVKYHEESKYAWLMKGMKPPNTHELFSKIYLYCKDNDAKDMFMLIYDDGLLPQYDKNNSKSLDPADDDEEFTLCCNKPLSEIYSEACSSLCSDCDRPITHENLVLFQDAHIEKNITFYSYESECWECKNYETELCPPYRNLIIDWIRNGEVPQEECIAEICDSFQPVHPYSTEATQSITNTAWQND